MRELVGWSCSLPSARPFMPVVCLYLFLSSRPCPVSTDVSSRCSALPSLLCTVARPAQSSVLVPCLAVGAGRSERKAEQTQGRRSRWRCASQELAPAVRGRRRRRCRLGERFAAACRGTEGGERAGAEGAAEGGEGWGAEEMRRRAHALKSCRCASCSCSDCRLHSEDGTSASSARTHVEVGWGEQRERAQRGRVATQSCVAECPA